MNIRRRHIQQEKISDQELLDLMERDPQAGMEAAMEQYTGLLWKVSEKYLQDPEDIKECINDTFLELYIHRDRFEPEKGTLTAYLAQIMRNLSINRYRKNVVQSNLLPAYSNESMSSQELLESQIDLERMMASLKPEDAEIIRMKYYGGMTVREIAASLNLPYDTVKKRHQRSLSKLKMLMLGILVLVLLATLVACAYALLRYFGIVPGYGISEDPNAMIFTLEESVQAADESGTYTIYDAMLLNGKMYISMRYQPATPELSTELMDDNAAFEKFMDEISQTSITLNGESVRTLFGISNGAYMPGSLYKREDYWEITWNIHLPDPKEIPRWDEGIEVSMNPFGMAFVCRMVQVKANQVSDYPYQMGSRGGLLAIPRLEDGRLIVGIYPLNTGTETLLTSLLRGSFMEGKIGDVTVTAPDGQALVGECVFGPSSNSEYFYDWDFGPAQPGEYTLHVPYAYMSVPVEEPFSFHLDLQQGTWDNQEFPLPGGTLSIESCQPVEVPIGETIPGAGGPFTMEEGCRVWNLRLHYTPSEDLALSACVPNPEMEIQEKVRYDIAVDSDGNFVPFKTYGFTCAPLSFGNEDNIIELSVWGWDGCYDLANVVLTVNEPLSMRWEHSFDLPLVVEAG